MLRQTGSTVHHQDNIIRDLGSLFRLLAQADDKVLSLGRVVTKQVEKRVNTSKHDVEEGKKRRNKQFRAYFFEKVLLRKSVRV